MTESYGQIQIRVPADPHMSRVLRLAASGAASLSVYTVDEIEDIKIAVSEILLALIEHGAGLPVDISLDVTADQFDIDASTDTDELDTNHPNLVMCEIVLAGLCASHEVRLVDGRAVIRASFRPSITHEHSTIG